VRPLVGAAVQQRAAGVSPIPGDGTTSGESRPGRRGSAWRVPAALVALGLIPVLAGSARLVELAGGPQLLPARFDPSPVPLVVHLVSVFVYVILGAFQFSAPLRRGRAGWHRRAGRLLVLVGMAVVVSALWLTLFHPRGEGGDLLHLFRLLAGSGMAVSLILGYLAIRSRDITRHLAWMTRAYALALGAGTQVFTIGIGEAILGTSDVSTALMQGAGWAINLAVAEWIIRRHPARRSAAGMVVRSR
jgi:hypothetical protein